MNQSIDRGFFRSMVFRTYRVRHRCSCFGCLTILAHDEPVLHRPRLLPLHVLPHLPGAPLLLPLLCLPSRALRRSAWAPHAPTGIICPSDSIAVQSMHALCLVWGCNHTSQQVRVHFATWSLRLSCPLPPPHIRSSALCLCCVAHATDWWLCLTRWPASGEANSF